LDFTGDLIASIRLIGDKELPSRVDVVDITEMKVSYERHIEPRMIVVKSLLFIDLPIKAKSLCIVWNLIK